ncbi:MAG: molecular chaperone DjiA, partial [Pseudomonadota bacterium]
GVGRKASPEDVRSAYHKLLKALHPDGVRAAGLHEYFVAVANDISARIVSAYDEIKSDQEKDKAA